MSLSRHSKLDEVDHLLRNAELRNQLEPLCDESIERVNVQCMPTPAENEFLASMLAWEQAPILPIGQWFEPELMIPHPDSLDDAKLHAMLWGTIRRLFEKRIVLDFTDHLSDRQLYCLLFRDILPAPEKRIESSRHYLHWDCAHTHDDPTLWLRFYASTEDRAVWAEETDEVPPASETPPFSRNLPRAPL